MEKHFDRSYGIAVLVSVAFLTFTVGLHPAGGGIEHLIEATPLIVSTHTIAIISVPVLLYGMFGFSRLLGFDSNLSIAGLITFSTSMFAVIIAAALNGLALPFFISGLKDADENTLDVSRQILRYGFSVNQAFDVIFIIFVSAAVVIWSIAILKSKNFPAWLGVFGLLAGSLALITLASGFVLTQLSGFRVFMAGFILWLVAAGYFLLRRASKD
ncbi:MAG: hypothetical protein OEM82_14250 [Acidobacteriota bacterium]|nr:hypothetical protein [Acidobacteriota bacterium]MDH3531054.1 hypothetical protein [Acidobacteriota bacterium]